MAAYTWFVPAIACLAIVIGVNGIPTKTPKAASISVEEVNFILFTRKNPSAGSRLMIGNASTLVDFDNTLPTKILVHGYMDSVRNNVIQLPKNALLDLEAMNVIGVGWEACAKVLMYDQVVDCAAQVGGFVAQLITWLVDSAGLPMDNVHCIGHSLGAQVISGVSKVHKIPRMSGLDAAGPLFTYKGEAERLDASDAVFVDAIHTSTKIAGIRYPVGHVDFYPNGGAVQPGCGSDAFGGCAHSAAYKFFAHSVSETGRNQYMGTRCDTVDDARNGTCTGETNAPMGYGATKQHQGIYYLKTETVP